MGTRSKKKQKRKAGAPNCISIDLTFSKTNIAEFRLRFGLIFWICMHGVLGGSQNGFKSIGPWSYADQNKQWTGFVNRVCPDPRSIHTSPQKNCLIGTEHGGIFKNMAYAKDSFSFVPVTDALDLPNMSITDIKRSIVNPDHILASCGSTKHIYITIGNAAGLLFSDDNGDSWKPFKNMFYGFSPKTAIMKLVCDQNDTQKESFEHFFVITRTKANYNLYEYIDNKWINHQNLMPHVVAKEHNAYRIDDFTQLSPTSYLMTCSDPYGHDPQIFYGYRKKPKAKIRWINKSTALPKRSAFQSTQIQKAENAEIFLRTSNHKVYRCDAQCNTCTPINYGMLTKKDGVKNGLFRSAYSDFLYLGGIQPSLIDLKKKKTINFNAGHDDVRDIVCMGISEGKEIVFMANDGGLSLVRVDTQSLSTTFKMIQDDSLSIHELWRVDVSESSPPKILTSAMHNNTFYYDQYKWEKIGCGDGGIAKISNDSNLIYSCNQSLLFNKKHVFSNNYWFLNAAIALDVFNDSMVYFTSEKKQTNAHLIHLNLYSKAQTKIRIPYSDFEKAGQILFNSNTYPWMYLTDQKVVTPPKRTGKFFRFNVLDGTFEDLSNASFNQTVQHDIQSSTLASATGWMGISDIAQSDKNPSIMYLSFMHFNTDQTKVIPNKKMVFKSDNQGQNFYDYSKGLNGYPIRSLYLITNEENNKEYLLAGSENGLFIREENKDASWTDITLNLPRCPITDMTHHQKDQELYLSTYGRGLYKIAINELIEHFEQLR